MCEPISQQIAYEVKYSKNLLSKIYMVLLAVINHISEFER